MNRKITNRVGDLKLFYCCNLRLNTLRLGFAIAIALTFGIGDMRAGLSDELLAKRHQALLDYKNRKLNESSEKGVDKSTIKTAADRLAANNERARKRQERINELENSKIFKDRDEVLRAISKGNLLMKALESARESSEVDSKKVSTGTSSKYIIGSRTLSKPKRCPKRVSISKIRGEKELCLNENGLTTNFFSIAGLDSGDRIFMQIIKNRKAIFKGKNVTRLGIDITSCLEQNATNSSVKGLNLEKCFLSSPVRYLIYSLQEQDDVWLVLSVRNENCPNDLVSNKKVYPLVIKCETAPVEENCDVQISLDGEEKCYQNDMDANGFFSKILKVDSLKGCDLGELKLVVSGDYDSGLNKMEIPMGELAINAEQAYLDGQIKIEEDGLFWFWLGVDEDDDASLFSNNEIEAPVPPLPLESGPDAETIFTFDIQNSSGEVISTKTLKVKQCKTEPDCDVEMSLDSEQKCYQNDMDANGFFSKILKVDSLKGCDLGELKLVVSGDYDSGLNKMEIPMGELAINDKQAYLDGQIKIDGNGLFWFWLGVDEDDDASLFSNNEIEAPVPPLPLESGPDAETIFTFDIQNSSGEVISTKTLKVKQCKTEPDCDVEMSLDSEQKCYQNDMDANGFFSKILKVDGLQDCNLGELKLVVSGDYDSGLNKMDIPMGELAINDKQAYLDGQIKIDGNGLFWFWLGVDEDDDASLFSNNEIEAPVPPLPLESGPDAETTFTFDIQNSSGEVISTKSIKIKQCSE